MGERIAIGRLCGDAVVAVVQAADLWRRDHASGRRRHIMARKPRRTYLVQRAFVARMRSFDGKEALYSSSTRRGNNCPPVDA